jgi:hypothetical protein
MYKDCCLSRLVTTVMYHIAFYFLSCLVSNDKKFTFILGSQESAKWDAGVGPGTNPSISYSQQDKKVTVELVCSDKTDADFQVVGEDPINNYKFRLSHKCACWNGCGCKLFQK